MDDAAVSLRRDRQRVIAFACWASVLSAACGPTSQAVDVEEATRGTSGAAATGSPSTSTSMGGAAESSGSDSSGDVDRSPGFIDDPDWGTSSVECNTFVQDCPPDTKCNPHANDGGGAWNATACFPVVKDPDEVGEPCTVEGSGFSGMDSCEVGAMCWNVDLDGVGECAAFCQGDEANPICPDPSMQCNGPRGFPLCLPTCCPLEQDCPQGQACYAFHHDFACAPDVSGTHGEFGSPCEFVNVCDPGLLCLGAAAIGGCDAAGCCTALCELGFEGCGDLRPGLECIAWFAPEEAPPGLEHVGVCVVPE